MNKTTDSLTIGKSDNLTPDDVTNKAVKWTSSDTSLATVDSNGKVTALKKRNSNHNSNSQDGSNLSSSCTVNVTEPTTISLDKTNDSTTRKFDLTQDEFNDFMNWYTNMSEEVKGTIPYYIFSIPAQGSTPAQKHCVPFAKIESFEFE
ncbi:Ig-like domain-containing protein [Clostridium felsineum]|uniref:Ig-like domain-containing protein n=1 Tax=Clostridium felsineum TaxID=36839 RepID=UPI00214D3429|nr:Ig-like domain-containing protein [Clostridium felsineum]MCR3759777.1 Ig-like domain-containing protein [Clostridium felsineum]